VQKEKSRENSRRKAARKEKGATLSLLTIRIRRRGKLFLGADGTNEMTSLRIF